MEARTESNIKIELEYQRPDGLVSNCWALRTKDYKPHENVYD